MNESDMSGSHEPVSIERDGNSIIKIQFSDGKVVIWSADGLRKRCPCATCREKKRAKEDAPKEKGLPMMLPVLSAAEARPLSIESMHPVGQYGYNVQFSDGHSSGIFLFDILYGGSEESP